jgi:nitrile hydratase
VNGAHDMGGMMGFGPVVPEKDEPRFHAAWERRAFGLTLAMGAAGGWNIDQSRSARESQNPADYLAQSYYEIWITGLEKLLAERGLVSAAELTAGRASAPPKPLGHKLTAAAVPGILARGSPTQTDPVGTPCFAIGDRVRARLIHPKGHTRLPRYVRGHIGTVTHNHGCHVFPDTRAAGTGEDPHWLYTVRFNGRDLWGPGADPTVSVSVDAWERYLEVP